MVMFWWSVVQHHQMIEIQRLKWHTLQRSGLHTGPPDAWARHGGSSHLDVVGVSDQLVDVGRLPTQLGRVVLQDDALAGAAVQAVGRLVCTWGFTRHKVKVTIIPYVHIISRNWSWLMTWLSGDWGTLNSVAASEPEGPWFKSFSERHLLVLSVSVWTFFAYSSFDTQCKWEEHQYNCHTVEGSFRIPEIRKTTHSTLSHVGFHFAWSRYCVSVHHLPKEELRRQRQLIFHLISL